MNISWSNLQRWKANSARLFWYVLLFTVGLFSLGYYMNENLRAHQVYLRDTSTTAFLPCYNTPKHLRSLVRLLEDVITVMDSANITNFLLYGTLWGAYRFRGPLPWDHDADIGIIGDKNYHAAKSGFKRAFERKCIEFRNDWISASYRIKRGKTAKLGIFVFNDVRGTMKRPGIESWIGYIQYKLYHTFPAWMAQTPLPTMKFGWINARVPRGKREIFKHLYPFHWHLTFLPTACKKDKITMEYLSNFIRKNVNTKKPCEQGDTAAGNDTICR